ncbi:MAG: hypothetical protein DRJ38_00105 [Thermoprotei archaeon]|nr:MAG: hypothetical protein DRJ38_00105 [Thermoprotei archaeon]
MGFTWSREITSGTDIRADDVNEIKNNIDTIYSELGINYPGCTGAGWIELPVSSGDPIESADFQELRDRLDYGWDHRCPSHDSADNSTYNDAVQTADHDDHDSTHYNDDNNDHNGQNFDTHYNDENTGHLGSYDSSDDSGEHTSDWLADYTIHYDGVRESENVSNYSGDRDYHYPGYDSEYYYGVKTGNETGYHPGADTGYNSGDETAEKYSDYTSYCGTHEDGVDSYYYNSHNELHDMDYWW